MPHFGLMDEDRLGPVEGPLMRARLHIRGGKRRLRQGKISAGIVTLYDALTSAMEYYAARPDKKRELIAAGEDNLRDDRALYAVLVRFGVLDGSFGFDAFDRLVRRALEEEMPGYDWRPLAEELDRVFTALGVMPFDEGRLPPEDPSTF